MAYIQERKTDEGKIHYRVQVRLRGYPTASATFERKTDAKLWAQQTENAMRDGRHFKLSEAKKHNVGELVDRYIENVIPTKPKNAAACTAQLWWWKSQLGHCLLSDLTPALIAEQRDKLLKGTTPKGTLRSPSTVVRYLAALSHALTIATKEWGWLDDSPMKKVTKPTEPRGRVRFLDDHERTFLLKACQEKMGSKMGSKWGQNGVRPDIRTFKRLKNGVRPDIRTFKRLRLIVDGSREELGALREKLE